MFMKRYALPPLYFPFHRMHQSGPSSKHNILTRVETGRVSELNFISVIFLWKICLLERFKSTLEYLEGCLYL